MNEDIQNYINIYSDEIKQLFIKIRDQIINSVPCEIEERLWAKLPSYYVGNKFVRLIPFKDHINIEASAFLSHKTELERYKMTPKGMFKIYLNQEIPVSLFHTVFKETLIGE
jgi:hypothetical protein